MLVLVPLLMVYFLILGGLCEVVVCHKINGIAGAVGGFVF